MQCSSCGQRWPMYTMPSYDPRSDRFGVCGPCVEQSRERERREQFSRDSFEPEWVQRVQSNSGVVKVFV